MEYNFNVNNLLGDVITRLDRDVKPHRKNANGYSYDELQSQLFTVIDKMGDASSRAQGLRNIITTGRKLQLSDHILYLMKDGDCNNGKGAAVGFLKIGFKKLFVYNHHGNQHEMDPMCVLDFYVHESRQRMGCGRQLFDFMLRDQNILPQHFAIDKPSYKFSQFLLKHYNLRAEIPQVNNFVIFEGFFNGNSKADVIGRRRQGIGMNRPPTHPNRRTEQRRAYTFYPDSHSDEGYRHLNGASPFGLPPLPPAGSRPSSGRQISHSAGTGSTPRKDNPLELARNGQLRPISPSSNNSKDESNPMRELKNINTRNMMPRQVYSRHSSSSSPPVSRPNSNTRLASGAARNGPQHQPSTANDPPLLPRAPPSNDYHQNLNLHQDYQGRRGHMRHQNSPFRNPIAGVMDVDRGRKREWQTPQNDQASWTVFNREPSYLSLASRTYTHTRLW